MHTEIPQPISFFNHPPQTLHIIFLHETQVPFTLWNNTLILWHFIFTNESENLQNLRIILYF